MWLLAQPVHILHLCCLLSSPKVCLDLRPVELRCHKCRLADDPLVIHWSHKCRRFRRVQCIAQGCQTLGQFSLRHSLSFPADMVSSLGADFRSAEKWFIWQIVCLTMSWASALGQLLIVGRPREMGILSEAHYLVNFIFRMTSRSSLKLMALL